MMYLHNFVEEILLKFDHFEMYLLEWNIHMCMNINENNNNENNQEIVWIVLIEYSKYSFHFVVDEKDFSDC